MKAVVVDWDDAFIDTDDFSAKNAEKTLPVRRYTVGWFVCETDKGIVLATDYYDTAKDGYAGKLFIPHGMINEWYDIERQ